MIDNNLFLLISVIFIILEIIIVFLFMNHLKFMRIFIEELRRAQIVTYKELAEIKKENTNQSSKISINESYNPSINKNPIINNTITKIQEISSTNLANNNQGNINVTELKSSKVSEAELLEMLKDTEQIFAKKVNMDSGKVIMDIDIDIEEKQ